MARLIRRRVKGAFITSLITFVLTLIYVNLNGISWAMSFLIVLSLVLMLIIRKRLYHRYFVYSWEDKTKGFPFLAFTILVLLVLGGGGFGLIYCHLRTGMFLDILFIFGLIFYWHQLSLQLLFGES